MILKGSERFMKTRKIEIVLTSLMLAVSFCITSLAGVSTPTTADKATSSTAKRENGKELNVVEALRQDVELDDGVNIEIPMDLSFSIDPINLMERGQIQSKDYTFKNNSDRDVRITFSEIYYTFSNDEDFRSLKSIEELNSYSTTKDIFLYLENISPSVKLEALDTQELKADDEKFDPNVEDINKETDTDTYLQMEEQKVVITDKIQYDACSFVLPGNKNSLKNKITFRFNGAVTEFPEELWDNSDIEVYVSYDCVFEEKEEKLLESIPAIEKGIEAEEIATIESETLDESGLIEKKADDPDESEALEEKADSSKENNSQSEKNETKKDIEASGGCQPVEDKELPDNKPEDKRDTGDGKEEQDSSQKEDISDIGNSGNYLDNKSDTNGSSEKKESSGNRNNSDNDDTSEESHNSEENSSSEKKESL